MRSNNRCGSLTAEGGRTALKQLMVLPHRPTAVLCSKDLTAIGLLAQARDCGLAVPQELSVVGTDNVQLSQFTIPPLTTIHISSLDLAKLALSNLIRQVRNRSKTEPDCELVLTPNLVLRQSTGLPSAGCSSLATLTGTFTGPGLASRLPISGPAST